MKQALLWVIFGLLAAVSGYYAVFCHRNFGSFCMYFLTAASLGYAVGWRCVDRFLLTTLVGRVFLVILACGCAVFLLLLCRIAAGPRQRPAQGDEKAAVVLGCAVHQSRPSRVLECRLEAALAWWRQHPTTLIVVCGGQGAQEILPEGSVMAAWLKANGVPTKQILVDATSTSTKENFCNAMALLEQAGLTRQEPFACVTNGFHCLRAGFCAKNVGFTDMRTVSAALPLAQYPICCLREVFALVYYGVFKRRGSDYGQMLPGLLWLDGRQKRFPEGSLPLSAAEHDDNVPKNGGAAPQRAKAGKQGGRFLPAVKIREMQKVETRKALDLVWKVFCQYEAPDYGPEGAEEFYKSIHDPAYLSQLCILGAFANETLVGVIATRNAGTHIALFFVQGEYQKRGIGRALFQAVRQSCPTSNMTVNASPYAVPVYHRLGFCDTAAEQEVNGLRFTQMEYRIGPCTR